MDLSKNFYDRWQYSADVSKASFLAENCKETQ